eukprot:TRINITY_DN3119_c1_g2_i1.p1 TRINITY_DN3119_c1_g2~~TRINITY_DN3119_c1_g2_i1.p1  ORF type:complete len:167 (-),score=4.72 TRINITY_DN3119_c1_g2_i1:381-881(-)
MNSDISFIQFPIVLAFFVISLSILFPLFKKLIWFVLALIFSIGSFIVISSPDIRGLVQPTPWYSAFGDPIIVAFMSSVIGILLASLVTYLLSSVILLVSLLFFAHLMISVIQKERPFDEFFVSGIDRFLEYLSKFIDLQHGGQIIGGFMNELCKLVFNRGEYKCNF